MRLMWEALKAGDPTALGLPAPGAGYSTSWTGIIYTCRPPSLPSGHLGSLPPLSGALEDLAIRCYLYERTLRTTRSSALSIVLSSALFSLLHLTNQCASLISCLSIFLVGAFFCLLVAKLRSPWAAFGCHAAWNFTQAVLFGLPNSGYTTPFALFGIASGTAPQAGFAFDPVFGIEASPLCGIIFAAAWHSSPMPEGAISSRTISGLKRHFPLFRDRTICMQRQAAQGAIPHAASAISCMFRI